MRFLSLFSGIEAASMAWIPLGWECVGVAEIEPFPCKLLAHYYPDVPNLGDITKITEDQIKALGHIDLIVGGFPCQDLSVAGKRKGLKNEDGTNTRSGLFFDAMRIVRYANPRFLLIENVPGIYSSNSGRDFAAVAGEILGVRFDVPPEGWKNTGVAASERGLLEWTTLDAQWFGVPQRRRRMFALADFGNWQDREPILFERNSMCGNPAPKRQTGEGVAGTIGARTGLSSGAQDTMSGHMIPEISRCLVAGGQQRNDAETETLIPTIGGVFSYGIQANIIGRQDHNGGNGMGVSEGIATTLTKADQHGVCVVPTLTSNGDAHSGFRDEHGLVVGWSEELTASIDLAGTLQRGGNGGRHDGVMVQSQVRRLTPRECERLQGFPDDWTLIPVGKKMAADGPRYKALGNSMAVPVMHWIGSRIQQVEQIINSKVAA